MTYSQLLQKLARLGISQVSKENRDGYDVVRLARTAEVCFPFAFSSYRLILDRGGETEIDEEVIDAILRRFEKNRGEFDPMN